MTIGWIFNIENSMIETKLESVKCKKKLIDKIVEF